MELHERLRKVRLKTGLNQSEFAEKAGIKIPNYSSYERGVRRIYPESLIKIAELTHVNLHWLITGEGKETVSKQEILETSEDLDGETKAVVDVILSENLIKTAFYNLITEKDDLSFNKKLKLFAAILNDYRDSDNGE